MFSLFLSLFLIWMLSLEIPPFSVSHSVSFSPVYVSLSLTPFSSLRSDHQQRRRVKFFFLLLHIFSFCTTSACSSDHTSFLFIHPPSQLTSVLVYSSPFFHCSPWNSCDSTKPQVKQNHKDTISYFVLITS